MKSYKKLFVVPAVIFWIIVWHYWSKKIGNEIFLPSPEKTFQTFKQILGEETFWLRITNTLRKIMQGFSWAVVVGFLLGTTASFLTVIRVLADTLMGMIKAVPVASFTILALLFMKSENMAVLVSFIIVLPSVYTNVMTGYDRVERDMKEMSRIYRISVLARIRYMYLPHVLPALFAACQVGIGLAFKSGVSAEVIAQTTQSVGYELYQAKLYLNTDRLFAWTMIIIILSTLFSQLVKLLFRELEQLVVQSHTLGKVRQKISFGTSNGEETGEMMLKLQDVSKSYGKHRVIEHISLNAKQGDVIALMGESGVGKTTLGNLMIGGFRHYEGKIEMHHIHRIGVVFQENRLLEYSDVYTNLYYITQSKYHINQDRGTYDEILEHLGLKDSGRIKIQNLSGGMKRRVAIARALLVQPDLLLLDEPFHGLDGQLKEQVINYIKESSNQRITVFITHSRSEAEKMGAKIIELKKEERKTTW